MSRSWPARTWTRSLGEPGGPSRLGELYRRLVRDSPLHWLGPACGVMHMATGAVLNACWDLAARRAGQPLWLLLAGLSPEEIIGLVDFRYLSDALTPDEALGLLERGVPGRAERIAALRRDGYPAYSTAPGWLGYSDQRLAALCAEAVEEGFTQVKLKVGAALEDDKRRCAIAREVLGDDIGMAIDANQVWDVPTAIGWIRELAPFRPAWVEEPTAPEDVLGAAAIRRGVAPVKVATGEHVANPVMFKQLLQADAIDIMQIDACRVAGVNENIANLLLAAKFGVPVCPHAGGVGLCEIVQHLSMFDYVALSGTTQGRRIEWIDHLHEHFAAPAVVSRGRYRAPEIPGRVHRDAARGPGRVLLPVWPGLAVFITGRPVIAPGLAGLRRRAHRRAVRAGQRRGGHRHAPGGLGCGDPRLRHRAALRGGAVRAADRRFPGRASARRVRRVHQGRAAAGAHDRSRLRGRSRTVLQHPRAEPGPRLQRGRRAAVAGRQPAAAAAGPGGHRAHPRPGRPYGRGAGRRLSRPGPAARGRHGRGDRGRGQLRVAGRMVRRALRPGLRAGGRAVHAAGRLRGGSLFPLCRSRGVAVLAGGVFNSGILADPADGAYYDYALAAPGLLARARRIAEVCAGYDVPIAAAALRYVLRHPAVTAAVVGVRTPDQIRADAAYPGWPIPDALWADLASL